MANSIRDQLLQAGLVTEEQVTKAESDKQSRNKNRNRRKPHSQAKGKLGAKGSNNAAKSAVRSAANNATKNTAKRSAKKKKAPQSDLAKFYQQRSNEERKEKQEEEKLRQEAAKIKKERRQKIGKLIKENAIKTLDQNSETEGEIRYNFVVGTNIKYLFVSEDQQQQLSEGKLAITFLGGKKMLIPSEIGKQILDIDPKKIVSMSTDD